jgi:hypothetical protein
MINNPKVPKTNGKNLNTDKVSIGSQSADESTKKKFYIETIAKFCDKCGSQYTTDNVKVVQESNFSSIIHFSCSNCKSNHIATYVKPMGISSRVPVNTDLTIDEISKFAQFEGISSNEVLDIYEYLEKNDLVKSF